MMKNTLTRGAFLSLIFCGMASVHAGGDAAERSPEEQQQRKRSLSRSGTGKRVCFSSQTEVYEFFKDVQPPPSPADSSTGQMEDTSPDKARLKRCQAMVGLPHDGIQGRFDEALKGQASALQWFRAKMNVLTYSSLEQFYMGLLILAGKLDETVGAQMEGWRWIRDAAQDESPEAIDYINELARSGNEHALAIQKIMAGKIDDSDPLVVEFLSQDSLVSSQDSWGGSQESEVSASQEVPDAPGTLKGH